MVQCKSDSLKNKSKLTSKVESKKILTVPTSTEVKVPTNTKQIVNSRMNLLKALSKAKNNLRDGTKEKESEEEVVVVVQPNPVKKTELKRKLVIRKSVSSNSSESSSQVPAPKVAKRRSPEVRTSRDDESNDSDMMKHVQLPPELPEPEINDQEGFMRVLGLFTHDFCDSIKKKKKERKRRNVKCTERNDFHYGTLNLDEVSFLILSLSLSYKLSFSLPQYLLSFFQSLFQSLFFQSLSHKFFLNFNVLQFS